MPLSVRVWSAVAVISFAALPLHAADDTLPLEGVWQFRLDPTDVGEREAWFGQTLAETVTLPGSLQEQDHGNDVAVDTPWVGDIVDRTWFTAPEYARYRAPGNIKVPFWLQPDKHYVGPAWYRREVTIPDAWQGKRILLTLERPHWETTLWIDGTLVGSANSLSTPHVYNLTGHALPGRHTLALRVDNRVKIGVGVNAHSVSDHTQTAWNGLIGEIALEATDPVWIEDVQVYPNVAARSSRLHVTVGNATGRPVEGTLTAEAAAGEGTARIAKAMFEASAEGGSVELDLALGEDAALWDEFAPNVYQLEVGLEAGSYRDERRTAFGLREMGRDGTQLTVNGRRIFLRGTLECCIFPLTGYPPTDVEAWRRIFRIIRAHGLNHMRFHSWCPPEAAFTAADEAGVYLQVECAAWVNQGSTLGDGKPIDQFIMDEGDRILRAYGNHPSFSMMASGNEPAGERHREFLAKSFGAFFEKDRRRVYTSAAGWPILPECDYFSTPEPRIQAWGAGLKSRINARPPETVTDYRDFVAKHAAPVVAHEIGQWCVYPNFAEMAKYTGVLKPRNFEIFRESLAAQGMLDQAEAFLMASGQLQALCYKEEIESALRTPGFGGFQLLDLHDFPGQGTALVGVLDPFWEEKGYITAEEYHRFCCETVPLARLTKRVWTTNEKLTASLEIAHYGAADLVKPRIAWSLTGEDGRVVAEGRFAPEKIATGGLATLGKIECRLDGITAAEKLVLRVAVEETEYANAWDVWVYPREVDTMAPADVLVADGLTDEAMERLKKGGKVLLVAAPGMVRGDHLGKVPVGFSSIFWNTAWTHRQPPHTLGILCDPAHAALAEFPTESHSNWQWWDLITRGQIMILEGLPRELRPVVQVIDDWVTNRRLGLVLEAKVGAGRLMVSSIDLGSDLEERPAARQMRHSLLKYMASERFQPAQEVTVEQLRTVFQEPTAMQRLGTRVLRADSAAQGYAPELAIDGDETTFWHTSWEEGTAAPPHELVIDLGAARRVRGFTYLPRQDMTNGRIGRYEVYVGDDVRTWGEATGRGEFSGGTERERVEFAAPAVGRYFRLVAVEEVKSRPWTTVAELEVEVEP